MVFADVANELTLETLHGIEDASGNNIAINFGKPNFDLVDPIRVGWGIMDPYSGVSLKELKKFLPLIRTRVDDNDVDLATCWLTAHDLCEEIDELRSREKHGMERSLNRLSTASADCGAQQQHGKKPRGTHAVI